MTYLLPCSASSSSKSFQVVSENQTNGSFDIVTDTEGCAWTAVSNVSWLIVTTPTGTGNGTVYYQVLQNNTEEDREGSIAIGSFMFKVYQNSKQTFVKRDVFNYPILSLDIDGEYNQSDKFSLRANKTKFIAIGDQDYIINYRNTILKNTGSEFSIPEDFDFVWDKNNGPIANPNNMGPCFLWLKPEKFQTNLENTRIVSLKDSSLVGMFNNNFVKDPERNGSSISTGLANYTPISFDGRGVFYYNESENADLAINGSQDFIWGFVVNTKATSTNQINTLLSTGIYEQDDHGSIFIDEENSSRKIGIRLTSNGVTYVTKTQNNCYTQNTPFFFTISKISGIFEIRVNGGSAETLDVTINGVPTGGNPPVGMPANSESSYVGCDILDGQLEPEPTNLADLFGYEYALIKQTVDTNITQNTRQMLEGYFARKYLMQANLPSNHPYKTEPARTTVISQAFTGSPNQPAVDCNYLTTSISSILSGPEATSSKLGIFVNDPSCGWSITNSVDWLTVNNASGTGNAEVEISVSENTGSQRTGTITVSSSGSASPVTISVTQAQVVCEIVSIDPVSVSTTDASSTRSIAVTTNGSACSWTATTTDDWITITSGASGTGLTGTIEYSVAANTGESRVGTITVGNKTHSIVQDAVSFVPWDPSEIESNVKVWFKADAINGLNDGDNVMTWVDSGPNGWNANALNQYWYDVPSNANSRTAAQIAPFYRDNYLNGLPVVDFPRSNLACLDIAANGNTNDSGERASTRGRWRFLSAYPYESTIFIVCKSNATGPNDLTYDSGICPFGNVIKQNGRNGFRMHFASTSPANANESAIEFDNIGHTTATSLVTRTVKIYNSGTRLDQNFSILSFGSKRQGNDNYPPSGDTSTAAYLDWRINGNKVGSNESTVRPVNTDSNPDYVPRIGGVPVATSGVDYKTGGFGWIAEILVVDQYVDETTRQKVEGYLAHKWGLTDNLPFNHPYKSSEPGVGGGPPGPPPPSAPPVLDEVTIRNNASPTTIIESFSSAVSGDVLLAGGPTSSDVSPTGINLGTVTYQWRRNLINISGATNQTYTLTGSDIDSVISVVVKATNNSLVDTKTKDIDVGDTSIPELNNTNSRIGVVRDGSAYYTYSVNFVNLVYSNISYYDSFYGGGTGPTLDNNGWPSSAPPANVSWKVALLLGGNLSGVENGNTGEYHELGRKQVPRGYASILQEDLSIRENVQRTITLNVYWEGDGEVCLANTSGEVTTVPSENKTISLITFNGSANQGPFGDGPRQMKKRAWTKTINTWEEPSLYLHVISNNPNDNVKNIVVLIPGFDEFNYTPAKLNPKWKEKFGFAKVLRFFDHSFDTGNTTYDNQPVVGRSIDSGIPSTSFWERVSPQTPVVNLRETRWTHPNNSTGYGNLSRLEHRRFSHSPRAAIEMCNQLNADLWWSHPYNVIRDEGWEIVGDGTNPVPIGERDFWIDTDYINGYATLVNTYLNSGLKVYTEWSNESWNGWNIYGGSKRWGMNILPRTKYTMPGYDPANRNTWAGTDGWIRYYDMICSAKIAKSLREYISPTREVICVTNQQDAWSAFTNNSLAAAYENPHARLLLFGDENTPGHLNAIATAPYRSWPVEGAEISQITGLSNSQIEDTNNGPFGTTYGQWSPKMFTAPYPLSNFTRWTQGTTPGIGKGYMTVEDMATYWNDLGGKLHYSDSNSFWNDKRTSVAGDSKSSTWWWADKWKRLCIDGLNSTPPSPDTEGNVFWENWSRRQWSSNGSVSRLSGVAQGGPAPRWNLKLVAYEMGQHNVPYGNYQYPTIMLRDLQYHPDYRIWHKRYIEALFAFGPQIVNGVLTESQEPLYDIIVYLKGVDRDYTNNHYWGLLESITQPPTERPKYMAILDILNEQPWNPSP